MKRLVLRNGQLQLGYLSWQKEEDDRREGFSTAWTLILPNIFYFRPIQGHSGGTLVDPTLQDNALFPDDFAEYAYHIGNTHDMHFIQGGLIPVGKTSKKGQVVSVFHSREPDVRQSRSGRSSVRSGQTENYGVQKYLESSPKYSILVQSEARSKKRTAVPSNPIARNRSFSTHHQRFVLRKW